MGPVRTVRTVGAMGTVGAVRTVRAVRTVGAVGSMRGVGIEPALDAVESAVRTLHEVTHVSGLARLLALVGLHVVRGLLVDLRELCLLFLAHGSTPIRRIVLWAESASSGGRSC